MKRWMLPGAAAAVVLAVVLGLWWAAGVRTSGGQAAGGGGTDPAAPWTVAPVPVERTGTPVPPDDTRGPRTVRIDSYHLYAAGRAGRRVAVNYTIGVPQCYGTVEDAAVVETRHSVTVTLQLTPPPRTGDVACIEIALFESLDIVLSEPLGERVVLDGSTRPPSAVRLGAPPGTSRPLAR